MLQKHVEIYRKCLVKVQFLIGHAEDGTKNLKQHADFDLSDKPRSRRPSLIDDDVVKAMLEQDPFLTTSEKGLIQLNKPFLTIIEKHFDSNEYYGTKYLEIASFIPHNDTRKRESDHILRYP